MAVARDDAVAWWHRFSSCAFAERQFKIKSARKRQANYLEAEKRVLAAVAHVDNVAELAGVAFSVFDTPAKK